MVREIFAKHKADHATSLLQTWQRLPRANRIKSGPSDWHPDAPQSGLCYLSRLLSCCALPHYPCSSHLKQLPSNTRSSCLKEFAYAVAFACNRPPCTPTRTAPLHQLLPIFKTQPEKAFHLCEQTRPLLPSCLHQRSLPAPLSVVPVSLCVFLLCQLVNYLRAENVSRSSLVANTRHSARLKGDAQEGLLWGFLGASP